ncbi:MAG: CoA transferase [Tepidiforma sp.]|nr:MAG: CoA transferase [Tepidiforma sp.]
MPGALEGIRVLDCTQIIAGPLAASLLSEMGADVVKVEPLEGEPWRLQAEVIPKESKNFLVQNRGKRGIALNFKDPRAAPIRDRLIASADVLITNYRPGVPEALGIDYESARSVNPTIIYAENTAFGKHGPDAMRRGYDIVAQAMSGLSTSNPNLQNGLPMPVAFAPADVVTGYALAWAITAALYHRQRTGEGQAINSSLLLSALALQAGSREVVALDEPIRKQKLEHLAEARTRGASMEEIIRERRRFTPELSGNIYYRPYKTRDSYLVVGCLGPGPRARFRDALGITDPRYEPGFDPARLHDVAAELVRVCEEKFLQRTNAEWLAYLDQFDIACGPVRFVEELFDDPQVAANGFIEEYDHTLLGPMRGPAPVVQMSATPTRIQRASPALGEHTDEVLREAGFDDAEIARFRAERLVG